jgi:c-di-GMP-binding flagellar brake protein YcgR
MMSVEFSDKRRTTRFEIQQEITVVRGDAEFIGVTLNISLGGVKLRVELDPPPRIGDRVSVALKIPKLEQPLRAEAQVRWRDNVDKAMIGVQFLTGFRAKETWALGQYLEAHGRAQ